MVSIYPMQNHVFIKTMRCSAIETTKCVECQLENTQKPLLSGILIYALRTYCFDSSTHAHWGSVE